MAKSTNNSVNSNSVNSLFLIVAIANLKWPEHKLRDVKKDNLQFIALKQSIEKNGVREAIEVYRTTDGGPSKLDKDNPAGTLFGLNGLQRFTACQELGIKDIPAMVFENLTDSEILEHQILTNFHKVETSGKEYQGAILQLIAQGATFQEVATKLAIPVSTVERWLSFSKLPNDVMLKLRSGEMPVTAGELLVKVKADKRFSEAEKEEFYKKALAGTEVKVLQAEYDREKLEKKNIAKAQAQGKRMEYHHTASLDRDRATEMHDLSSQLQAAIELGDDMSENSFIKENAKILELSPINIMVQTVKAVMDYIYGDTLEDQTKGRIEWENKHKKD